MQEFQKRVIEEEAELSGRLTRLQTFLGGSMFGTLPMDEQERLRKQVHVMGQYRSILAERIKAFA